MPRYYFHLASKDSRISDDDGKELASLSDAYEHARKLIDQILFHVGHEDAEAWKVIISSAVHDGQIIIPFHLSYQFLTSHGLNTGSAR
jgi:uncharacterized protein DUF6894